MSHSKATELRDLAFPAHAYGPHVRANAEVLAVQSYIAGRDSVSLRFGPCEVCWTNSWAPCSKSEPEAVPMGQGDYALCQLCYAGRIIKEQAGEIHKLKSIAGAKPLVLDNSINTPCTARLEVDVTKLVSYFEQKHKENIKRAEKQDAKKNKLMFAQDQTQAIRSAYYFSGKADTYKRAADKLRELMEKEQWIVEAHFEGSWRQSKHVLLEMSFTSKESAEKAIKDKNEKYGTSTILKYRVVRKS